MATPRTSTARRTVQQQPQVAYGDSFSHNFEAAPTSMQFLPTDDFSEPIWLVDKRTSKRGNLYYVAELGDKGVFFITEGDMNSIAGLKDHCDPTAAAEGRLALEDGLLLARQDGQLMFIQEN